MTPLFVRLVFMTATAVLIAGCSAESKRNRALERASGYYRNGDFERALIEYQNVLQQHPDDPTANERLALIWFDRGATMRSMAYLTKMYQLSPGNLELRLKRAQLIASLGRAAEARREALAILERSTSIAEALVLLTETVRDPEEFKAADQFLQKFPERNTVSYYIASANLLMLGGDATKAKAALQRALAVDPKSPAAHSAMAALYVSQNNAVQAAAEHKIAAELSPIRSPIRLKHAGYLAQTGAVAEAIAALKEITRQAPDYAPAWRALAQIAMLEKRNDEALAFLQTVITRDHLDYEAQVLRARVLLAKGDVKQAITDLQRLGEVFSGIGLEKYPLALAHLQDNDQPNAIAALQQTVALFPDNIEAIILLAQLNIRAGAPQPAAAAMVALVTRRPDLMQPYLLLIEATKALGKLDDLVRVINANLVKVPNNAQLHYVLGVVYGMQEKLDDARRSFERALEGSPNAISAIVELVNLDLREGKKAAALQRAQALVAKAPKMAAAHFLAARVYAADGKWSEVESAAIETIKLEANHTGAYGLLSHSLLVRKEQPEIVGKLERFLAQHPNEMLAVLLGGQFYTQTKQFAKAAEIYEKFLTLKPMSGAVLNNLADLNATHLNRLDRALELARKAREVEPTAAAFADTLGWIHYQRKEFKEALPLLEESAKKLPGNPEVQFHLGMVQRALGQNEAALAAFKLGAAAPGDFAGKEELKRQLAELEQGSLPTSPKAGKIPKGK